MKVTSNKKKLRTEFRIKWHLSSYLLYLISNIDVKFVKTKHTAIKKERQENQKKKKLSNDGIKSEEKAFNTQSYIFIYFISNESYIAS